MTVNRNEVITLPKWLVIVLLPMLVSGIVAFATIRSNSAKQEEKVYQVENKIKIIDEIKVDRNEFLMMQRQLDRIEDKLDKTK